MPPAKDKLSKTARASTLQKGGKGRERLCPVHNTKLVGVMLTQGLGPLYDGWHCETGQHFYRAHDMQPWDA